MIYNGDYYNGKIYTTSSNNKIKVVTEDDANFLSCEITVVLNDLEWSHPFEIPFFNDEAELYFDNYIHSIITQMFNLQTVNLEAITNTAFPLADITLTLKEMNQNTVLSELDYNFSMLLGNLDVLDEADLDNGLVKLLPNHNPLFITDKGVLSYSYLSDTTPTQLIVDDGLEIRTINLSLPASNSYLQNLVIPVKLIDSSISKSLTLSLKFSNNTVLVLGDVSVIDKGTDHNIILYQNNNGTLSFIEMTGELKEEEQFQIDVFTNTSQNISSLNISEIKINTSYSLNTGYWLDARKYKMLSALLKSYNIYLGATNAKKIVLSKTQNITPYQTDNYENNETLNFKLAKNDDPIYGTF